MSRPVAGIFWGCILAVIAVMVLVIFWGDEDGNDMSAWAWIDVVSLFNL